MSDDAPADFSDTDSPETGPPDDLKERAADLTVTIRRLLHEGNYLDAVIYARDAGGLGVRQARGLVEHIAAHEGLRVPKSGCAALANLIVLVIGLAALLAA